MAAPRSHRLGPLELAALDALWTGGPAGVHGVHAAVGAPRALAPNTIQSTLERLARKRLVERLMAATFVDLTERAGEAHLDRLEALARERRRTAKGERR